jgi:hypothetical protein
LCEPICVSLRLFGYKTLYVFIPDLSTLANVVTTLANMDKKGAGDGENVVTPNGNAESSDSVAKAFDTLAKAVQPETSVNPVCIK